MQCWNCGKALDAIEKKPTFRTFCEECQADLHCCKNCKYFKPGMPNDCMVPGTDFISDRVKANFCEEFSIKGLFIGKNDDEANKKRFDDLFK